MYKIAEELLIGPRIETKNSKEQEIKKMEEALNQEIQRSIDGVPGKVVAGLGGFSLALGLVGAHNYFKN